MHRAEFRIYYIFAQEIYALIFLNICILCQQMEFLSHKKMISSLGMNKKAAAVNNRTIYASLLCESRSAFTSRKNIYEMIIWRFKPRSAVDLPAILGLLT
jgi:hypothetical protein